MSEREPTRASHSDGHKDGPKRGQPGASAGAPRTRHPPPLAPRRPALQRAGIVVLGIVGYGLGMQGIWTLFQFLSFGPSEPALPDATTSPLRLLASQLGFAGAFVVHHHAFASPSAQRWLRARVPTVVEQSLYVGLSGGLLWLWVRCAPSLPGVFWDLRGTPMGIALWILYAGGWMLAIAAVLTLNQFRLFGLLGAWREFRGRAHPDVGVIVRGPYRWLRHPMYSGFLIACWATPFMHGSRLAFALFVTIYAWVGSRFEERKLLTRYPEAYREYRRRVRAWWPHRRRVA